MYEPDMAILQKRLQKKCIICKTIENNSTDYGPIEMLDSGERFYKLPLFYIYERISRLVFSAGVMVDLFYRPGP
jgi:hypothetical protein